VVAVAEPMLVQQVEEASPSCVWIAAGRSTQTNELLVGALHERGVRAQLVAPAGPDLYAWPRRLFLCTGGRGNRRSTRHGIRRLHAR
jgi:hypothetical protein